MPDLRAADEEQGQDAPGPKIFLKGKQGDGIIYEDMLGGPCKGRTYKVGEDGRHLLKPSLRPKKISPEDWQRLLIADRERLKNKEQEVREAKATEERAARKLCDAKRAAEAEEKRRNRTRARTHLR